MSNGSDNENAVVMVILFIVGLVVLLIWKFSTAINVDLETGLSILLRTGLVVAAFIALVKLDFISVGAAFPALLSGLAWAFFPALDYWSAHSLGKFQFEYALSKEPEWYARWYSKATFFLLPSFAGYGLRYAYSK